MARHGNETINIVKPAPVTRTIDHSGRPTSGGNSGAFTTKPEKGAPDKKPGKR
jgi:hypothetical protein